MIRVRKLVLAIAAATSLSSGMAQALGLGEISLQSALNQPLNADIQLMETRDLDKTEIIPRLASAEDFSKAGVERSYFLSDLKFTPVILPNGKSMIHVTSSKPVREPYLNFLVEVIWPSGRVLREYTLLLDPPLYSPDTAAVAPQLPVAAPAPAPASRTQGKPTDGPFKVGALPGSAYSSSVARSENRPSAKPVLDGQYKTGNNDTLWDIAQRVKGSGSLNQTMLAIQDLNPDAFTAGNINRLKSGQVLRLPDAAQINARSNQEAAIAVAEQNTAWREGRSLAPVTARQLDATKRDAVGAAPAEIETKDSLRLIAADTGKAASASEKGTGEDSKVLSDKLAVTQESLDTSRRQGEELTGRVTDLQSQLEKLQKLIELKDSQLAQLQADLAAREKLAAETAAQTTANLAEATPEAVPVETPPVAEAPVTPTTEQSEDIVVVTPEVLAEPEPAPKLDADQATPAEPEIVPAESAETPVAVAPVESVKPVESIEPVQIVTETVVVAEPEQVPVSFIDELLENPLLLGVGGAGLLIILLGLMAASRRNALKDDETAGSDVFAADAEDRFAEANLPDEAFSGMDEQAADAPSKAPVADALGEADIYIAYGKFNQAAELLQNAINDEPERTDLQLKLLEVLGELGDREGFLRQAADLEEIGSVNAQLEQARGRYPAMAAAGFAAGVGSTVSANVPDDLDIDDLNSDPVPVSTSRDSDDEFDLSLDELDIGLDDEPRTAASVSEQNLDEFSLDIDFDEPASPSTKDSDFDLSFEDLSVKPATPEANVAGSADDEFADFNFDFEAEPASPSGVAESFTTPAEPDFDFDALPQESSAFGNDDEFNINSDSLVTTEFDLPATDTLQPLEPIAEAFDAQLDESADDEDFDFLSGADEAATKLDLARAYIDMGDAEGARDILDEVVAEGSEAQQQEARELIGKLA